MIKSPMIIDLRRAVQAVGSSDVRYYTIMTWNGIMMINAKKYTNPACTVLAHDIDITWANGVPVSILDHDVINNTTEVKNITWSNGVPVSVL